MNESRIFWRESDPDSDAKNEKAIFLPPEDALPPRPQLSIRELFAKHYEKIREWLVGRNQPGVALVAMDFDAVRGAAFLAAKPDVVSTAIIGRHSQADLRLAGDPSLSLRHLALLVYPRLFRVIGPRVLGFSGGKEQHRKTAAADESRPVRLQSTEPFSPLIHEADCGAQIEQAVTRSRLI